MLIKINIVIIEDMEHNMILSASGWRKIFTENNNEESKSKHIGLANRRLCALIGETFAQYTIAATQKKSPVIAVATDTRPTGSEIADAVLRVLLCRGIKVHFLSVSAAPEIMAYARTLDGFLYISASHNPVGHNGIKFGLNDGGVVPGSEAKKLADSFRAKCGAVNAEEHAGRLLAECSESSLKKVLECSAKYKKQALAEYENFLGKVITGFDQKKKQDKIFSEIKNALSKSPVSVLCDMNGSARTLSVDRKYMEERGIKFLSFNDNPGQIVHAIIPEPENLVHCAKAMTELQNSGKTDVKLGYMPDCDGDRGNIVYWDDSSKAAKPIPAQEVFALCVAAEISCSIWSGTESKIAVAVNGPTSMRTDEICAAFGACVFRAEVGEANVVNLAREKREEGYSVRILGEGSNGGNITYPSSVRDPLATIFAIIKLLAIRDSLEHDGTIRPGLFHLWCIKSGQENKYKPDFTLSDILASLPAYTTTGVSESRAVLHVKTEDKGKLKLRFQKLFEQEWKERRDELKEKYGIESYAADTTNGTKEIKNATDWNNGNGGLKIRFMDSSGTNKAFIWMRPSGTESVFRVMCDTKGIKPQEEHSLLEWETSILMRADAIGKQ